jgi:predicted DNA-binding transcriptional regulator AlpA
MLDNDQHFGNGRVSPRPAKPDVSGQRSLLLCSCAGTRAVYWVAKPLAASQCSVLGQMAGRQGRALVRQRLRHSSRQNATECDTQLPLSMESAHRPPADEPGTPQTQPDSIMWMRDVVKITRVHRCTIYRWIQIGRFPAKDAPRAHPMGWLRSTVQSWLLEK